MDNPRYRIKKKKQTKLYLGQLKIYARPPYKCGIGRGRDKLKVWSCFNGRKWEGSVDCVSLRFNEIGGNKEWRGWS